MKEIIKVNNHDVAVKEYNGQRVVSIDGKEIDKYKVLAAAVDAEDIKESYAFLKIAGLFNGEEVFDSLYFAVLNTVTDRRMIEEKDKNEIYFQNLFNKIYPKISNGEIISVENDGKNIPDSWVREGGEILPVEVKKTVFGEKALKQLQRYIKAYKCNYGIAVGRTLKVNLPKNIKFVSLNQLEQSDQT